MEEVIQQPQIANSIGKMMIKKKYISKIIFTLMLLFAVQSLTAQQEEQMLIFQIDGNNYIKKNYDKNKKQVSSQIFKVGKVMVTEEKYVMPLKVYLYDKNGVLEDSANTKYTCKPSDSKLLMNVFPFAQFSSNKTVTVELENGTQFYPSELKEGLTIPDIIISLSIDGGVIGSFFSDSQIKISERKIVKVNNEKGTYVVTSKLQIKAYMLGIRVDTINYIVTETISKQKGILEQTFVEDTGEYFTIKLNNK